MQFFRYMIVTKDRKKVYTKNKYFEPLEHINKVNPMIYRTKNIALAAIESSGMTIPVDVVAVQMEVCL